MNNWKELAAAALGAIIAVAAMYTMTAILFVL